MKRLFIALVILLIIAPTISAKQGHLKLLAVKETKGGYEGAIADLYLEIKEGTGRVYLDTFPLTKVDTQISTRFGKDIACNYLNRDCENYDFAYTIRADSSIIAGPSAGAAITLLTVALLDDLDLNEKIGVTGTINSGGIVGPVGGIKEKIDAAKQAGLKKVLIPKGERFVKEDDRKIIEVITASIGNKSIIKNASISNKTVDLVEYGKNQGIDVLEVSDINEVLYEFTGKKFEKDNYTFTTDKKYEKTMSDLTVELCNRSDKLEKEVKKVQKNEYNSTINSILNLTSKAENAIKNGKYYSAASYCFGSNVKLTYLLLLLNNATKRDIEKNIGIIEENIKKLEKTIDKKEKRTITDLESYAVVKERLIDAEDYKKIVYKENASPDLYSLAYSFERVYSAFSWYNFFDHRGKEFIFDKESLKKSCQNKIAEAEERYQYVSLFYPILDLSGTRKEIDYAYKDLEDTNYELCLFKATQAKAESDIILSVSGVGEGQVDDLVDKKIEVAKKNIAKQVEKGSFPILGYSYYEYANDLRETDKYSALLYAEYAIELSNLDIYFKQKGPVSVKIDFGPYAYVIAGIVIGFLIAQIPGMIKKRKKKNRK